MLTVLAIILRLSFLSLSSVCHRLIDERAKSERHIGDVFTTKRRDRQRMKWNDTHVECVRVQSLFCAHSAFPVLRVVKMCLLFNGCWPTCEEKDVCCFISFLKVSFSVLSYVWNTFSRLQAIITDYRRLLADFLSTVAVVNFLFQSIIFWTMVFVVVKVEHVTEIWYACRQSFAELEWKMNEWFCLNAKLYLVVGNLEWI